jgi:hypothetical protein
MLVNIISRFRDKKKHFLSSKIARESAKRNSNVKTANLFLTKLTCSLAYSYQSFDG